MSARQRERLAKHLASMVGVRFAFARVYPRQIEKRNISGAANLAALRAFSRLAIVAKIGPNAKVFLDGGLFLGSRAEQQKRAKNGRKTIAKTVIKGDEKIPAVAAASILAKVYRDRLMTRMAKKYPAYGFEVHKGYGTAAHRRAVKKHGPTPIHRLTFLGKSATISI